MIKACLNGDRSRSDHPRVPITPAEIALDSEAVVTAGAGMVHVHPRDESGRESLQAGHVVTVMAAIRSRVPGLRVSVSTRDGIAADARAKIDLIAEWPSPDEGGPDCASVNWHEPGAVEVAEMLRDKGIGVEAGIWTPDTASAFASTTWPRQVERVLVEVIPGVSPGSGGAVAAKRVLTALRPTVATVLVHGEREWAWFVMRWAHGGGFDVRIGLEDTLTLPTGVQARDNAELLAAATCG